jgi:hypothetical protein
MLQVLADAGIEYAELLTRKLSSKPPAAFGTTVERRFINVITYAEAFNAPLHRLSTGENERKDLPEHRLHSS